MIRLALLENAMRQDESASSILGNIDVIFATNQIVTKYYYFNIVFNNLVFFC